MSTQSRTARSLAALRDCGPYLAIELILPGGTLVALLLYLSRRYLRGSFGVAQSHARRAAQSVGIKAKPEPGKALCMCLGHTVLISGAPNGFEQRCAGRGAQLCGCCA